MNTLFNIKDAARYCGLPLNYFHNLLKAGGGPAFVRPSPRRRFFFREELDRWMHGWQASTSKSARRASIAAAESNHAG
jgi:hypothetical protein